MCKVREQQIIKELEKNLPSNTKHSSNLELEEYLDKVVSGMCDIIFEKTHSECRMAKDLKGVIEQIANESASVDPVQLNLLNDELDNLVQYVKCIRSGNNGERKAFTELRHLTVDGLTTIEQNITLKVDDEEIAEYDDLVISPNGVFIVEVKNRRDNAKIDKSGDLVWSNGKRVNYSRDARRRKFILKEMIKDSLLEAGLYNADIEVEEILLWTNDYSSIENLKPQSVITKRIDEVCDYIDGYPCRRKLDQDEISAIKEALAKNSIRNEYPIQDVHLKSLYERFAYVIATYENERAESMAAEMASEMAAEPAKAKVAGRVTKKSKPQILIHVAKGAAVAIASAGVGFITQRIASRMFRSESV